MKNFLISLLILGTFSSHAYAARSCPTEKIVLAQTEREFRKAQQAVSVLERRLNLAEVRYALLLERVDAQVAKAYADKAAVTQEWAAVNSSCAAIYQALHDITCQINANNRFGARIAKANNSILTSEYVRSRLEAQSEAALERAEDRLREARVDVVAAKRERDAAVRQLANCLN